MKADDEKREVGGKENYGISGSEGSDGVEGEIELLTVGGCEMLTERRGKKSVRASEISLLKRSGKSVICPGCSSAIHAVLEPFSSAQLSALLVQRSEARSHSCIHQLPPMFYNLKVQVIIIS